MSPSSRKPRNPRPHQDARRISVRGVRREQPDVRKLARALIALAMAQAEADAQAEAAADRDEPNNPANGHEGPNVR